MIGQPQIVIGAEINDALRPAVVGDGSPRVGGGAQLRFVKLDRPRSRLHPPSETRRRLERVAPFARKKVAQAELGGILVHKKAVPESSGHGDDEWGETIRFS